MDRWGANPKVSIVVQLAVHSLLLKLCEVAVTRRPEDLIFCGLVLLCTFAQLCDRLTTLQASMLAPGGRHVMVMEVSCRLVETTTMGLAKM
jgi:hypothetical protein